MISQATAHPKIVTEEEWLAQRKQLLAKEKELTRERDRQNAERRRLPMVKVDKQYLFDGPNGKVSLLDLFEGQTQLVIYHFMYGPDWKKGCEGCTGYVNELGNIITPLKERNTNFVLVSRAPLETLEAYRAQHGWTIPWYSSLGSDFNYDYHATLDEDVAPVEYNYKTKDELVASGSGLTKGEAPGLSVFFRIGDDVYHTYSVYARGVENITDSYAILDITPYGRQEDFEDSPAGWPQKPTYG